MTRYVKHLCNERPAIEATSLDDMISSLQGAADQLRQMRDAGAELLHTWTVAYDHTVLATEDPAVARQFEFDEEEDEGVDEPLCEDEEDEGVNAPQAATEEGAGPGSETAAPGTEGTPSPPGWQEVPPELQKKLLSLGGARVVVPREGEPDLEALLTHGRLFTQPVQLRRGKLHQCHTNAAALWGTDIEKYRLATGYFLVGDVWIQHSWVFDSNFLYESISQGEKYFGIELDQMEASAFWITNFLQVRYPGPYHLVLKREQQDLSSPAQKARYANP